MMMEMDFSFADFQNSGLYYPTKHSLKATWDRALYRELELIQDKEQQKVERALLELKKRTTVKYYRKVLAAQTKALRFARDWFPSYKFIMPDALADDWLSTMDWHKPHQTRDHSLHQTLTACIVSKLLGNGNPGNGFMLPDGESLLLRSAKLMVEGKNMEYLRNYLSNLDTEYVKHQDKYDINWAVETFYETAMLAAQFHDMGYPWQFVNTLSKDLKTAHYDKVAKMMINDEVAFNEIKDRLLIYPLYCYQENEVKRKSADKMGKAKALFREGLLSTHGMPGALGFLCLNDSARDYGKTDTVEESTSRLILDWAAVAIMMHDMPGMYWGKDNKTGTPEIPMLRLNFETDPLSCLISIADILEEFERPKAIFDEKNGDKGQNEDLVKLGYDFDCDKTVIKLDNGKLTVTYYFNKNFEEKTWNDIKTRRANEVKQYLNPQTGYIDLSSWGITEVDGISKQRGEI